jgi:hypothetical protein
MFARAMPQFEFITSGIQRSSTQPYSVDRMEITISLTIIVCVLVQAYFKGIGRLILRNGTEGTEVYPCVNASGFCPTFSSDGNRPDWSGFRDSPADSSTHSFQDISQVACSRSELYNPRHRTSSLVLASSTVRRGHLHE